MSVLVSINCMTYNHEKYIANAIDSFLMQVTDFEFEILIGEDCSTDHTRAIVDEYVEKYPSKVKLITSPTNIGTLQNGLRLYQASSGKYIADCEGDDYWTDPYKLQKQVDYMESNPDCTLCFHAAELIKAPNNRTGQGVRPYTSSRLSSTEDFIRGGGGFCPTASLFYPRKLIEKLPDFYMNAHVTDYPLQLYLASLGETYYMDEFMSVYRIEVEGSWTNNLHTGEGQNAKMIEAYEGDIHMLQSFSQYTNGQYEKIVQGMIAKRALAIQLLGRKSLQKKPSSTNKYIQKIGIKNWLKVHIHCYFPKAYRKLAEIRNITLNRSYLTR